MDLELRGQVAIVTGGSSGIGKAVARELVREGASVVIAARNRARLDDAAAEFSTATGGHVAALVCDTASKPSVDGMVAGAVARFGGIDILVNCAARPAFDGPRPLLADVTDEIMWSDLNVKVMGYLRCMQAVAPHMIARGGGRIVNIAGLAARQTGTIVGSVRNVAVAAMTKNVADELGHHGISVVVVHPDLSRTERTPDLVRRQAARQGISEEEVERRMAGRNVLGRAISATEVAQVVAFLASPKAIAINGDAVVTGGGVPGAIYY